MHSLDHSSEGGSKDSMKNTASMISQHNGPESVFNVNLDGCREGHEQYKEKYMSKAAGNSAERTD